MVSTLVIDSLDRASLRKLLSTMGRYLHMNDENSRQPLGSLNLLQRLTLIAALIEDFQPEIAGIPMLVRQLEGKVKNVDEPDLQAELEISHRRVRDEFAPLAFLYDLRTHGGLAHPPNKARAAAAAVQLGLPEENWHRTDYLRLLKLVAESVYQIIRYLDRATQVIMVRGGLSEPG